LDEQHKTTTPKMHPKCKNNNKLLSSPCVDHASSNMVCTC